jgi:hypothetical protein
MALPPIRSEEVLLPFNEALKVTRSMHSALPGLSLYHLWVIHPETVRCPAHEKITMLPLAEVARLPQ